MASRDQYDKLNSAYNAAAEAGDVEAMGRLFTENALLLDPGRPPVSGGQAIRETYKEHFGNKGYKQTINVYDFNEVGDLAYGVGTFEAEGWGTGNFLAVLQRQSDSSYLIHRLCWNTH